MKLQLSLTDRVLQKVAVNCHGSRCMIQSVNKHWQKLINEVEDGRSLGLFHRPLALSDNTGDVLMCACLSLWLLLLHVRLCLAVTCYNLAASGRLHASIPVFQCFPSPSSSLIPCLQRSRHDNTLAMTTLSP